MSDKEQPTNLEPINSSDQQQQQPLRAGLVQLANGEIHAQGGMGRRLLARIVDGLVVGIPLWAVFIAIGDGRYDRADSWFDLSTSELIWTTLVSGVVTAIYEIWLLSSSGQTIGKRLAKVKVVSLTDGSIPPVTMVVQRWFLYGLAGIISGLFSEGSRRGLELLSGLFGLFVLLVFISPMFDPQRRGWHDKLASTVVVRV